MFIKKDLRKIPNILDDAVDCDNNNTNTGGLNDDDDVNDGDGAVTATANTKRTKFQEPLKELKLGRRQQEFHGSLQILCQPQYLPKLRQLQNLNLYDCNIHTLDGIGMLEGTPQLETINLGRNPLRTIPDELSHVQSLKHIWLDDCHLTGSLPLPLLQLRNLESLRLPNNHITEIPFPQQKDVDEDDDDDDVVMMTPLKHLQILCLDRNELQSLPSDLRTWTPNLKQLLIRHNQLEGPLRGRLPSTLEVLHVSSNQLTSLDALMDKNENDDGPDVDVSFSALLPVTTSQCPQLTHLYVNGNQLTSLPDGILSCHPKLQRLVLSHNPPLSDVPNEFWDTCGRSYGGIGGEDGTMMNDATNGTLEILWEPNPNLIPPSDI